MIDNRCCGRVKVVITRRVAQSHAGAGFPTSMSMPAFRRDGLGAAKVGLLPTFYWPDPSGTLIASVDSTPIIRRLEREHEGRSVLPSDPVVAFLDYLLEEYADEWLTKSVLHFRWYHPEDIEKADAGGPPLPSHHSPFFKIEPEPSVTMGVEAMTVAVLELLGTE